MTVKDFNHHKSNGGIAQLTTINAIESFKCGKKGSRNGSSNGASSLHRCSTDKPCSKCNTTHAYKECQEFGKKCHKCGNKNHFSSCCRSNVGQGQGCRTVIEHRLAAGVPERHHQPSRGRCSRSRSRSWSRSSNELVTRSTHCID